MKLRDFTIESEKCLAEQKAALEINYKQVKGTNPTRLVLIATRFLHFALKRQARLQFEANLRELGFMRKKGRGDA